MEYAKGNTLTVTRAMAHLSYDDTAGRTPAQNHRDKQKSRLHSQKKKGRKPNKPQAYQRLVCCLPGGSQQKVPRSCDATE